MNRHPSYNSFRTLLVVLAGAAAAGLGQPVPRLAAKPQRRRRAAALPHADQAVPQGRGAGATMPRRCSASRPTSCSPACGWRPRIVPVIATDLPLSPAVDVIALVGIFALARVFISLAAMDIGTSFGTLGARREMLVGFLAEPALLMVFFTAATDQPVHLAGHHRGNPGAQAVRDLPQPGLRRDRLRDGAAGRKCAHPGGQSLHPPRTDHDPRGHDPGIFGAPPGADRMGQRAQTVCLHHHRHRPVPALGHRRGRQLGRAAAGAGRLLLSSCWRQAPGWRCSKPSPPRCAFSACRNSWAPPSCWRCWAC